MPHDHHDHHHGHAHAPAAFGRAFAIGIGLNSIFVIVEAVYGVLANSMSLLADAGHNLSDILGLAIAYGASVLARRAATPRFTYGLRGSSILAALFNAVFLLLIVGGLIWEAVLRLIHPEPVGGPIIMVVAAIGIAINGGTALLFASGRKEDINIRGAYLHMAADALVSIGVVLAGAVIWFTNWLWLDPLTSLVVNIVIVAGTWGLLRDSIALSLQAVPRDVDPHAVRGFLAAMPGVAQLHDLHIWSMSTTETAMTVHLVMPGGHPGDAFLMRAAHALEHRFRIAHCTMQIESEAGAACTLMEHDHVSHRVPA